MRAQSDSYDEAAALCRLTDDGCPNEGNTPETENGKGGLYLATVPPQDLPPASAPGYSLFTK